jgi:hypothetical protein
MKRISYTDVAVTAGRKRLAVPQFAGRVSPARFVCLLAVRACPAGIRRRSEFVGDTEAHSVGLEPVAGCQIHQAILRGEVLAAGLVWRISS